ncbi:MAG: L-rhamnose mutarotase [Christensenella sp.]
MCRTVYFGQLGKLKKEKIEEYEKLHAECWPEIRQLIRKCNIQHYSIFRHEDLVLSYFEYIGEDYAKDMAIMSSNEVNKQWLSITDACFETYAYGDNEFCVDMKQIFYND